MNLFHKFTKRLLIVLIVGCIPLTVSATFLDNLYQTFFGGITISSPRCPTEQTCYNTSKDKLTADNYINHLNKTKGFRIPFLRKKFIKDNNNCLSLAYRIIPADIALVALAGLSYWYYKKR